MPATPANPTSRSGTVEALDRSPLCPNIAMPMATVSSPRHVQPLAGIRHASAYGKSQKPQAEHPPVHSPPTEAAHVPVLLQAHVFAGQQTVALAQPKVQPAGQQMPFLQTRPFEQPGRRAACSATEGACRTALG